MSVANVLTLREHMGPSSKQCAQIRVALAENNRMGGQMLSNLLRRDKKLEVVDATADPRQIKLGSEFDVAIIGTQLMGIDWFALLQSVRLASPKTRFVILLDTSQRELAVKSFRGGARGIFCRSDSLKLLPKCVHSVHAKQIWASAQILEFVIEALADAPITNLLNAEGERLLSTREQQVVRFVSEGFANREIARQLKLSEHTVKNYMFRIFNKLGLSSRVELILYAASRGARSMLANPGESE